MRVIPVPNQSDNYAYLLIDDTSKTAAAVDPFDVPKVTAAAEKEGVQIVAGITTHHHPDHSGGNKEFSSKYPGTPMYAGSTTAPAVTTVVKDKSEFTLGDNIHIRALHTPCHTQDSICFYAHDRATDQKGVFTGDTLFRGGCGRFFEGTADEMYAALSYLATLPDSTVVYDGHEYTKGSLAFAKSVEPGSSGVDRLTQLVSSSPVTTGKSSIGDEKAWNVFMRLDSEPVKKATGEAEPSKIMSKLRDMKNNFRG
ncbi:beta-lactamase-like protein [Gautieria morchelliformis]|nr:beta-lactamase-like protein [Gautieria morchelliformis]